MSEIQLLKRQVWWPHIKRTRTFVTHKLFLKVAESIPVPNWSTSFKIPWTFAFILKTWSDNDDCRFWNALSSRDCGIDDDGVRDGGARPASISWKLMLLVVAPLLRVLLSCQSWWGAAKKSNASGRHSDIMWLRTFSQCYGRCLDVALTLPGWLGHGNGFDKTLEMLWHRQNKHNFGYLGSATTKRDGSKYVWISLRQCWPVFWLLVFRLLIFALNLSVKTISQALVTDISYPNASFYICSFSGYQDT